MAKYPKPVRLPDSISTERQTRHQQVIGAARIGIIVRLLIILIELFGAGLTHSSALFTDAIASLMDLFSTFFLILCVKLARRPPDAEHPFGHGRYEPLGGLLIGLFLSVMGGTLFAQYFLDVSQKPADAVHPFAWVFSLIAVVLLEMCYRFVIYTAKKRNSPALAADAVHYRIDSLTSLIATVALLGAFYFPQWADRLDDWGALFIAFFMVALGLYAAKDNFHQLMDKAPDPEWFEKVKQAALQVRGVKATEKIRIQLYGPDAHIDIDIEVDPQLPVHLAHKISQQVRAEIQKEWPAVRDVTVHVEPYYANDH